MQNARILARCINRDRSQARASCIALPQPCYDFQLLAITWRISDTPVMTKRHNEPVDSVNKNVRVPTQALTDFEQLRDLSGIENISEFVRRTLIAYVEQSKRGQVRWPPVFVMNKPIDEDELYA